MIIIFQCATIIVKNVLNNKVVQRVIKTWVEYYSKINAIVQQIFMMIIRMPNVKIVIGLVKTVLELPNFSVLLVQ